VPEHAIAPDHGPSGLLTLVTPGAVKQAVQDTLNTTHMIQREIDTLQKMVFNLQDDYKGAAAFEFYGLMQNFMRQSNLVKEKLHEISDALLAIFHTYLNAETAVLQNNTEMHANIPTFNL
jgi:WXG100 family type VII secretion target